MTFKIIDSREAFRKEILDVVANIEQSEISLKAQQEEKKDGIKRCWKCGDHMCDVTEPYGTDRYYQCFTKSCNGRREYVE